MRRLTVYSAGPISGKSYQEAVEFFSRTEKDLGGTYDVLNPMTGKSFLRNELELRAEGYGNPVATNKSIINRDYWCVDKCDIFFLDLSNAERASVGSICELSWAWQLRKHIIVVMRPDDKEHNHAFIREMSHTVFTNREDAIDYLLEFGGKNVDAT